MNAVGAGACPLAASAGPLAPAFVLLTQLGDLWLYVLVLALAYWLGERTPVVGDRLDREGAATVIALGFGAVALTSGLKQLFAVPRPPGATTAVAPAVLPAALDPLYVWAATASGYSLPSGHALGTTVVWGGLAWTLPGPGRRRRLALAGAVVALVSYSRVALGVHRPIDVLVGIGVGAAYLAAVLSVADGPDRAFAAGAVVGLAALLAAGPSPTVVAAAGVAIGGWAVWRLVDDVVAPQPATRASALVTAAVGLPVLGAGLVATQTLALGLPGRFLASVALVAVLLGLPAVTDRLRKAS
ncbi:MAG: phosphatase PAP2 family protein [Haloarculaceae archaeon]